VPHASRAQLEIPRILFEQCRDNRGRQEAGNATVGERGRITNRTNFAKSAETDRAAIRTLAAALAGSNRPLVVTSGTLGAGAPGTIGTEDDPGDATRRFSESALDAAPRGVRGVVVRLSPTVHGDGDHGFVPRLIQIAREKGISGYPGEGTNRCPRCTAWMLRRCSGSRSSRRRRAPACSPPPRKRSPRAG
jgi:hypothetical protein